MSSARTLYSILNVIIFLILIGIGLGIFFFVMTLFGIKQDFLLINQDITSFKTEKMLYVFTILMLGVYAIFVVALWKLRSATKLLLKKDFYNSELIKAISDSGKFMVITVVFSWCVDGISDIFFKFRFVIGLSEKTIVYLFVIAIGLLLMLISKVLGDAKTLKDENDLTI